MPNVILIGNHPLVPSLIRQYEGYGYACNHKESLSAELDINEYDELCLLTASVGCEGINDSDALEILVTFSKKYNKAHHGGRKLFCHLLLQSNATLRLLQTTDFNDDIREKIDIYPFTMLEVGSRAIRLDYEPITIQSQKTVHLVLFGMGDMSEAIAINAAHVAHYPNFVRDSKLRTRITVVSENARKCYRQWTARYKYLFDNSYYRVVTPREKEVISFFHKPKYAEHGIDDFVDIEWEFVEASVHDDMLKDKLRLWSDENSKQLLSVVFAHDDDKINLEEVRTLPSEILKSNVHVYCYQKSKSFVSLLKMEDIDNIKFFGMYGEGYDVRLPLIRMAKTVNYIYHLCYKDNIANWEGRLVYAVEIDKELRDTLWDKLSSVKRQSNVSNAMNIPTKLHSVNIEDKDWEKFYDISQNDIEILAQVEHNRWSVEELILGWRPCNAEEDKLVESDISQKDVLKKRKIHYDLRPYKDLRPDASGKSVTIYDLCLCACLPLIAKTYSDEKGIVR